MKYITFTVPCYNSQDYMKRCIDSLLPGGEDVEIIIINDGSTDGTAEIADYYQSLYPNIVRAVHQKNAGHGAGVNRGLSLASGRYFKVVDSDDWLDEKAYPRLLDAVKKLVDEDNVSHPDLIVCNYIYDHLDEGKQHSMSYKNVFPTEKICHWNDMRPFLPSQYLIMHALIFRTELLKRADVVLPEHTFYVDNLFSYKPLPYVQSIYYMNMDLYHYYLGREDQSVNEKVLISRIDQQIKVTKLVAESVDLGAVRETSPKLASYMLRNISIMMSISCIHLLMMRTREADEKRHSLWNDIKDMDHTLYYRLKFTSLCGWTDLPGKLGGSLTLGGYRLARRIYQFQ